MNKLSQEEIFELFPYDYHGENLVDMLTQLTKDELNDIKDLYKIKRVSQLNKKQLIEVLIKEIVNYVEKTLAFSYCDQYLLLKNIRNNQYKFDDPLDLRHLYNPRIFCLIFPCYKDHEPVFLMPIEIKEQFDKVISKSLEEVIKTNTIIYNYAKGMTKLYGAIDYMIFLDKFHQCTDHSFENERINNFLTNNSVSQNFMFLGHYLCINRSKDFIESLIKYQNSRTDIEYYPFSKDIILEASNDYFIENNPASNSFIEILHKKHDYSKQQAIDFTRNLMLRIKCNQSYNELAQYLVDSLKIVDFEKVNDVLAQLQEVYNHTKQWTLKGYSPNELGKKRRLNENPKLIKFDKVGRNELCPCGSGKKYKKCCINKQE